MEGSGPGRGKVRPYRRSHFLACGGVRPRAFRPESRYHDAGAERRQGQADSC